MASSQIGTEDSAAALQDAAKSNLVSDQLMASCKTNDACNCNVVQTDLVQNQPVALLLTRKRQKLTRALRGHA